MEDNGAVVPATEEAFYLAEGPVWDPEGQRLLWLDIDAGELLEGQLDGATITVTGRRRLDASVGCVGLAADGTRVVAGRDRLYQIDVSGHIETGPRVLPPGSERRCNDGATDPAGRFLVGTLAVGGPSEHQALLRLEDDCSLTVIDDDLTLSNGIAWSADGREMFNVDTMRQVIYRRSYDPHTGDTGRRQVHVRLEQGHPDGIAMDDRDHLWVAVWGTGEVRRFAPDGTLTQRLRVPAPHTTSVAFAGQDLDVLVITTATEKLTAQQRTEFPDSGKLFLARPGVRGVPVAPWTPVDFRR